MLRLFKKDGSKKDKAKAPIGQVVLPPAAPLEDELKHIWKVPLANTPVYKDLPRLAQRIVVLGELAKPSQGNRASLTEEPPKRGAVEAKAPVAEPPPAQILATFTVYYNTSNIQSARANEWPKSYEIDKLQIVRKSNHKVVMEFYKEAELLCTVPIARVLAVEDSTRYFLMKDVKCSRPNETRNVGYAFYTREESTQFLSLVQTDLKRPVPIIKDLKEDPVPPEEIEKEISSTAGTGSASEKESGDEKEIEEDALDDLQSITSQMLASLGSASDNPEGLNKLRDSLNTKLSNIGHGTIRTKEEKRLSLRNVKVTSVAKDNKNIPIICAIRRVVNAVAAQIESKEQQKVIAAELGKPEYDSYDGDMEPLVESWFKKIGTESKTAAVLKACTQSIIHVSTYQVKSKLTANILTGDVRGPEGWQICILFANDVINISHRRREKSLDSLGPKSEFWFEWILNMCFNRTASDLLSATLRIARIQYGPSIDPTVKEELHRTFCGGDLLIA